MKDSKKLIEEARSRIKDILKSAEGKKLADETFIRDKVRNELGYFLFQKTERRPMILPVVIEV